MDNYIGKVVDGRYKIGKLLYSEFYCKKYLAEDSVTGKTMMVSIPDEKKINQKGVLEQFNKESEQICQLSHPNIFEVRSRGFEGKTAYIVTEYVEQIVSVDGYLSRANQQKKRILWRGAVGMAVSVLKALQYLHSKEILHGNISKNSVFIKVVDSKIKTVRLADIGFPALDLWLSPQDVRNNIRKPRKTDDLFSVGALLYNFLTGKMPYPGLFDDFKLVFGKYIPIIPPREHNPDIPLKLQYIIMHALEYRFQSAEEMLTSLQELLKSEELTFSDFEMQYAVIQKKAKEYR